jgi:hypothetical protein
MRPLSTAFLYSSRAVRSTRSSRRSSISFWRVRVTRARGRIAEARMARIPAVATISR